MSSPRRSPVPSAGAFAGTVAVLVVLGAALGAWWWAVAPPVITTWGGSGFFPVETEPGGYITADVQFGLWMLLFGVAISAWLRRRWLDAPLIALACLVLGVLGAAALAALVGGFLGPSATPDVLIGTRVEGPLRVRAPGLLLVGPIAAVAWWFAADLAASWRDTEVPEDPDDDAAAPETASAVTSARSEPSSPR